MSNRASLDITLGSQLRGQRKPADEPLRVLFMADFSGRQAIDESLKPRRITFETLDSVISALAPKATVTTDAPLAFSEELSISNMDDFHPDSLAKSLSTFRTLNILRDRLGNPDTRDEAMAQLAELSNSSAGEDSPVESAPADEPQSEEEGDMMERLLGSAKRASSKSRAQNKVESFIQNVMGAAQTEAPSPSAQIGKQQITELMEATMRGVLMSQPLRTLERSWRSAEWLIQRLDDESTEIHIVDLSKESLSDHLLENAGQLDQSSLHQLLCEPASGDSWDLLIGDYSFSLDAGDLILMTTIGALAGQAGAPFLSHGDLSLCGCESLEQVAAPWDWKLPEDDVSELWAEVRAHPAAQWVGLATPQILLRQPYGPDTDAIDAFEFDELPARPEPARFLWGNPAIGCAYLLARAHADELSLRGSGELDVEDLPTVLYDDGSGQALQAPVEVLIGERATQQIQAAGLIPMIGKRNGNSVRCADLAAVSITTASLLR